jgi:hypothetical protein
MDTLGLLLIVVVHILCWLTTPGCCAIRLLAVQRMSAYLFGAE